VSDDLLNRHMAGQPRFKDTWLRKRDDLIDQSQSGYDLALANFGFNAGLSEQEVVNLIIHHRRIHGQSPRTRLDYFQRTIAKACKRNDRSASANAFVGWGQEAPNQQSTQSKPDSATARALLCEQISAALGVRILRIVKITGKQPTYQMELESGKIEFPSVNKLVDQRSFRMTIASVADRFTSKVRSSQWDQITQMMLDALTIADGGLETDLVGGAQLYVHQYLSETPFVDSIETPPSHLRDKPAIINGQIAICSGDLQLYINKTRAENHPIKDVASMLTAIGASSTRPKGTRLRDQTRWLLPLSEFDPADYTGNEEKSDA
jgi:hypothetical protein